MTPVRAALLLLLLRAAALCLAAAGAGAGAEMHEFTLAAPAAREVFLAGDMTGWDAGKRAMQRGADGLWRVQVDLAPGEWVYKFIVDGRWIADPGPVDRDADGQGGQHSFLFVGAGDWSEPPAGVARGRVDTHQVPSAAWGRPMTVHVYLPPGAAKGAPLPVLWLLHGSGMDADQWLRTGRIDRYMDNLIARGAIRPFAIVMPSSADLPYIGASDRFIADELPAWLAATYGLQPGPAQTGVAGMSMGGTGALRLPLAHPGRYGVAVALSGYYGDAQIAALPRTDPLPMQTVLLCGRDDDLVVTNRALVAALDARHARFYYREDEGAHTWQYFSRRTVEMLTAADAFFATGEVRPAPNHRGPAAP